jgi:methionyl-tRNA formyltransferase
MTEQKNSLDGIQVISLDGILPSFKALTPEILHSLREHVYRADQPETVQNWAEKLMRYCEIFLPSLQERARKKCGNSMQSRYLVLQLAAFLLDVSVFTHDARFLNTVLKLLDLRWLVNGRNALSTDFQARLFLMREDSLVRAAEAHPSLSQSNFDNYRQKSPEPQNSHSMHQGGKVVIFSPSQYSLYTLSVAELLHRQGVQVAAIFTLRLLSPRRFFSEYRRDGKRLFQKIWKKLVLRRRAYIPQEYETIASFMQREKIPFKSVGELHKQYTIPVIYCKDLNAPVVVEELSRIQPDLVVFTGGGLIRKDVLAHSGQGLVNCHMGVLPGYRGRDVVEWPLLEGQYDRVGLTVHFMDEGVDTGDILRIKTLLPKPGESRVQLRERLEGMMPSLIVETSLDVLDGSIQRQPQAPGAGKQYFFMHPRLTAITEAKLK